MGMTAVDKDLRFLDEALGHLGFLQSYRPYRSTMAQLPRRSAERYALLFDHTRAPCTSSRTMARVGVDLLALKGDLQIA
jgi:hypothetical protein